MERDFEIRNATVDDAADIVRLYNRYVLETTVSFEVDALTVEQMAERIRSISAHYPYYVCERGGRFLGYCCAHPWKDRLAYSNTLETTIYLEDEAQRGGIGTALMERLVKDCRALGVRALIACITAENVASIAFHERLGFFHASLFKEVGYKFGRWLDVVDMELLLTEQP